MYGTAYKMSGSLKFDTIKAVSLSLDRFTPSEFMVFHFIWCRTIIYGKKEEFIPPRHFLHGIEDVIEKVPFKDRQLRTILKRLEEKELIVRRKTLAGSYLGINYNWPDTLRELDYD